MKRHNVTIEMHAAAPPLCREEEFTKRFHQAKALVRDSKSNVFETPVS